MSNTSALLSALNSRPQPSPSLLNNSNQDSPSHHGQMDPWGNNSSNQGGSSSHLPLSISQSINNPGLPSGVIVSSAAVNAMNGLGESGGSSHGRSSSIAPSQGGGGMSRSETPGLPNGAGGGLSTGSGGGGGGKLLLQGVPLITSSLIQPGSIPGAGAQSENEKVYYLIVDLMNPNTREAALLELSKKREQWDDLALVLWHSFGTFETLLRFLLSFELTFSALRCRCHVRLASRDRLSLPSPRSSISHRSRLEQSL